MPIWIPMAIAAGVSAASQIIGNRSAAKTARLNTNLTIAENKKLAEMAYQKDLQQLQAMNEYNSPKAQMQRFTDAGLNRNLIYSQGNPGNQSQLIKYNAPTVQYGYQPKWKGNEFDSIKDLPLQYYQIKNLAAMGRINEAKSVMEQALSKYADDIANYKQAMLYDTSELKLFERLFKEEEMKQFFSYSNGKFYLKPEKAELFIQNLTTRFLTPTTNLEKTQKDIAIKDQLLKNLSVIPWLQPLIQFLKMFN